MTIVAWVELGQKLTRLYMIYSLSGAHNRSFIDILPRSNFSLLLAYCVQRRNNQLKGISINRFYNKRISSFAPRSSLALLALAASLFIIQFSEIALHLAAAPHIPTHLINSSHQSSLPSTLSTPTLFILSPLNPFLLFNIILAQQRRALVISRLDSTNPT